MDPFTTLDSTTNPDKKGRFGVVIRGFSRYNNNVQSIGATQIGHLARFILTSFIPGRAPVTRVEIVGHADFDVNPLLEQQLSDQRAQNAQMALRQEVVIQQLPLMLPDPWNRLAWDVTGVGAAEPDEENIRNKKTPQNMSEEDRKRNRRVVLAVTTADPAIQINLKLTWKDIQDILKSEGFKPPVSPPPPQPPPPPNWFKPIPPPIPVSDPVKDFIKKVQDGLTIKFGKDWEGSIDPQPFFDSLPDILQGSTTPTFNDFVKAWQDIEEERRKRQINPPEREPK